MKISIISRLSKDRKIITASSLQLDRTESRVFVLYCTRREARELLRVARGLGLTRKEFVWIATQPVIGPDLEAPLDLVPGMLGVHYDTKNVRL